MVIMLLIGGIMDSWADQRRLDYVFTQKMIWEVLGQDSGTFVDSGIRSQYNDFKNDINSKITNMQAKPSFNGNQIEIDAGDSIVLTDSKGLLKDYDTIDKTTSGIRFQHKYGENTLTITVSENCDVEDFVLTDYLAKTWGLIKAESVDHDTQIYFDFPTHLQDQLYCLNFNDPVTLTVGLKINLCGNLELTKTNTNQDLVDGSIFNVRGPNGYNQDHEVKNGKLLIEKLRKGTYTVKEILAPEGYVVNVDKFTVSILPNQTTTQSIVNEEPTGTVSIIKKDKETGAKAQGDATFNGAIYNLFADEDIYNVAKTVKHYSKGDLVATRTMDKDGRTADITGLNLGKYVLKENKAPSGYLIDNTTYNIELKYKDQNTRVITNSTTSNEIVKKMQIHIFKAGIKTQSGEVPGLAGAEFTLKLKSDIEKALAQGYTYTEIWGGIDQDGNTVKVNSSRVQAAQVIAPTYDIIVTDEDGNAYSSKLPYGTYIGKETKTPKDYYTATDFSFSITQDESEIIEIGKKVKDIFINNEQIESYIKIVKRDLKTNKVVSLSSTTFQILADEDIYDRATGKIIFKKNEAITQKIGSTTYNTFTTNADNLVVPANSYNSKNDSKGSTMTPLTLPVGSYRINEIKIPTGFLQLDALVKFKIENIRDFDTDIDGDFIKEITVKNEQPTGTIIIDKSISLRSNADKSLIDIKDLSGIKFKLEAKDNVIDMSDGSTIYAKGQVIGTYNVDKNGDLKIENLPIGSYLLYEWETLPGLVLDDTIQEIKFTQTDTTTKVYTQTKTIENKTTFIEFSKTDITGEKEVVGSHIEIKDKDNKFVDSWVSTDETHKIEGLTVGETYRMVETQAADGYVIAVDVEFIVKNTSEIQKVTMVDKQVKVSKTTITGDKELKDAELQVEDMQGNIIDKWVSTDEEHFVNGLKEGEKYKLVETIAPDGYVVATEIEFTVSLDKETQKVQMIDKQVKVSKTDVTGEREVPGCELEVMDKDGNILDSWVSSTEEHYVKGLKEGEKYTLAEKSAGHGYVIATMIEFEVSLDKETQKVKMIDKQVVISKTDLVTGEEVEGAELEVQDKNGKTIDKWTSSKEPHYVSGLTEGETYTLIEKTAPYGYYTTENIVFTVSFEKDIQKVEMKDAPILKNVRVEKLDETTKEHIKSNKFAFGIFADEDCKDLIMEVGANTDEGTALFSDLRYGTYYIKETKAPTGYKLSDQIVKIEINDTGVYADGVLLEENSNTYSFEYYNSLLPVIQTGDRNILPILLAIGSLVGISVILVKIIRDKKRNNNRKSGK